ncbi:MAG: hypothetical protein H6557_34395 [Lewinellaceae bacterium]|nr:hypothetical protein [Phaeodactylibacter sp.]MCB9041733.1 hypothetical protein [Lewinellaceae bacterium]
MANGNRHIIGKQFLHLSFPNREDSFERQQEISKIYWQKLVVKLEELFDRLVGEDELVRLQKLEINLGRIDWADFEEEFLKRVLAELELEITRQLIAASPQVQRLSARENLFQHWMSFLEKGVFNWAAVSVEEPQLHRAVLDSLAMGVKAVAQLRQLLQNKPVAFDRLILQHPDPFLKTLVELYTGKNQLQLTEALPAVMRLREDWKDFNWEMPAGRQVSSSRSIRFLFWQHHISQVAIRQQKEEASQLINRFLKSLVSPEQWPVFLLRLQREEALQKKDWQPLAFLLEQAKQEGLLDAGQEKPGPEEKRRGEATGVEGKEAAAQKPEAQGVAEEQEGKASRLSEEKEKPGELEKRELERQEQSIIEERPTGQQEEFKEVETENISADPTVPFQEGQKPASKGKDAPDKESIQEEEKGRETQEITSTESQKEVAEPAEQVWKKERQQDKPVSVDPDFSSSGAPESADSPQPSPDLEIGEEAAISEEPKHHTAETEEKEVPSGEKERADERVETRPAKELETPSAEHIEELPPEQKARLEKGVSEKSQEGETLDSPQEETRLGDVEPLSPSPEDEQEKGGNTEGPIAEGGGETIAELAGETSIEEISMQDEAVLGEVRAGEGSETEEEGLLPPVDGQKEDEKAKVQETESLETPVTSQPGEQSPEQKAKLETEGSEEMEAGRMPESEEQAQQKGVEPSEKPSSPEKSEGSPKEKGVEKEKRKASGEGPKAPAEEADTEQIRIEKETAGLEETPTAAGEKRAEGEPESSEADKGEGISETLEAEAQKRDQKQLAPEQKAKEALEPEQKAKKKRKPSSRKKKEELEPEVSPLPEAEKGRSRERKYKAFGELPQGTTYYIRNAGVVLLHAFLPTYFRAIKLVEGASFVNEAAHHKAAHLIQYLAAREEGLPEYELLLPKFLCGLPFDIPLEREVEILETEKEEGENLLKAAIQHWGALGDASPDGLREGFLRRDGKLEKRQNGWYLMVEQKTLDILLGKLPWNLSLVKLPWMPDMLRVEWAK